MIVLYRVGTIPTESEDNDVRVRSRAYSHPYGVEFASTLGHLSRLSHISAPRDIPETPSNLLLYHQTRTAIRGSLRFAAVRVLRQRMSRGAPGPWVEIYGMYSRERFPFGIAFDARFDRCASSSPRRTADPPNKKRARLMLMPRAKRLSRDCQERDPSLSFVELVHPVSGWTSSGSETVAWLAASASVARFVDGVVVRWKPTQTRGFFSSRRVASSFARPPSNRRLNPSRPRARARASPLPPPPHTASNAQK